jgi:drug/metabolite transporter (DMT)-like permease
MGIDTTTMGIAAGLVASVAWTVANVAIQRASRASGPMVSMLWGQLVGSAVLVVALLWWPATSLDLPWMWVGIGGVASAMAYSGLFYAFDRGPLSVGAPIVAGWALVSTTLGVVAFGERLSGSQWVGSALVVGGSMVLAARSGGDEGWRAPRWQVIGAALCSCLGFGVMVTAIQPLAMALGPVASILVLWGTQWVILGPLLVIGGSVPSWRPPREAWGAIVLLGLFETLGFVAVDVGTMVAPISIVSPPASLGSLLTVVVAAVWLKEHVGWDRVALAGLIVAGVVLLGSG